MSATPEEEAPAGLVVGRTLGGLLLVIVGGALVLAGAFVYFVTPWVAPFTDSGSIWQTLSDLDIVGAIVGGLGLIGVFIGGALIQRARAKRLQVFMDSGEIAGVQSAMTIDLSKKSKPADPAPPTVV
jgi:hypothetical protein